MEENNPVDGFSTWGKRDAPRAWLIEIICAGSLQGWCFQLRNTIFLGEKTHWLGENSRVEHNPNRINSHRILIMMASVGGTWGKCSETSVTMHSAFMHGLAKVINPPLLRHMAQQSQSLIICAQTSQKEDTTGRYSRLNKWREELFISYWHYINF